MEITTLLLSLIVFVVVFLWFRRPHPHLPPAPMRALPVFGHLLYMPADLRPKIKVWRKQCGDIYSLYMGGILVVVLNGYDVIKEALVKKADAFSDRPPFFLNKTIGLDKKGLIFNNGSDWKEQRAVSLSILRDFGMGRNILAEKIQDEVSCYINYLADLKGKPTDIRVQTNISVSNIICSILIGRRFEYEDKSFQDLMNSLAYVVNDQSSTTLFNFFSWLWYLPGDLFGAKKMAVHCQTTTNAFMKFIEDKKKKIDEISDACNFIDAYIIDKNKKVQAGITTFSDEKNLVKCILDIYAAGTETTSTTIYWCILYLLNNPEVQEKVYQEIKVNVGTDRAPTINDKTQLTYLNAVINETQRLASIVPLSVTHMCSEEVTLRGYTIPKGTYIMPNLDSVLFDTTTWGEDAMSFRPERFLDNNGKLKIPEQFIPFGNGRRVCLGEAIAKMELFLYLASMFQKFKFLPLSPDHVPPVEYKWGIISPARPYEVRAVERT